ncbi:Microcystin-dependent protein [Hymenobacter daecheongensis DSM 21074]|uniref:Microcystin-dependent protein n=1 Tax=Hymenobacter daecheongensis DSM 21074 TaxID=1121955 RepID=A0A1M6GBS0_9BACT|nr:tail fiber protein [Hymenobacter daecheongensis]SHJ07339.1 Microcystin-dependent protein [Hymenobacter daecheongensis DSM 21074]
MDEYIGVVKLFAGTFAPQGWAFCNGQILPIAQYSALFSLLGTTYGGNGVQTFALPNLQGRVAVGQGTGPSLPQVALGQTGGANSVTLTTAQLPAHTHTQQFSTGTANTTTPGSGVMLAKPSAAVDNSGDSVTANIYGPATTVTPGSPSAIGITGNNQPVSVLQPYLGLSYIICLEGLYPARS